MARFLVRLIDAQTRWARPFGDFNHRLLAALFGRLGPVKGFLNGTWLGHPLHAVITDVPIGLFTGVILLDILDLRVAADAILVLGVLSMVAAAVTGLADYADTDGKARTRATVHGTTMAFALLVYSLSIGIRVINPGDRSAAIVTSIMAYFLIAAGAFVGGDVVYVLGNMVSRHAFRVGSPRWVAVDMGSGPGQAGPEVAEDTPTRVQIGGTSSVLVIHAGTVYALDEQCAHAGGPLARGKVIDGCIQCPWHGSQFRLGDGQLVRGPSVYDQPTYELRMTSSGGWEARLAK